MGHINFANKAQVWLWYGEIRGQISDGMWENATPLNHWEALSDATIGVGNPGKKDVHTRRSYDFSNSELLDIVGDRMLWYGKGAVAYPNLPDDESIIHAIGEVGETQGKVSYDHQKTYFAKAEAATGDNIATIVKKLNDADYSRARMVTDLRAMSAVVNGRAPRGRKSPVGPEESEEQRPQILEGLTFCITGVFPEKRDIITQKLESLGATANGSVSRGTQILIVGDKPGADKTQAAAKLNTKTVGLDWLQQTFSKAGVPFGKTGSFEAKSAFRRQLADAQARKVMRVASLTPSYTKFALDKKHEWERVYEGLKDILDILTGMDEKPVMQSELHRLIQTAKAQAKLWEQPKGLHPQNIWMGRGAS